jgi:hypothetical protein
MPSASPSRKLTTHQQSVLIQVLLAFPDQRVAVHYSPAAADGFAYAQNFLTIFKAVGWQVSDAEQSVPQPASLAIVVSADGCLPPGAEALRDALRIYGIEVETTCDPAGDITAGSFVLGIGADG